MEKYKEQNIEISEIESAGMSMKTNRGLELYEWFLQLTDADLIGKHILDLDSGSRNDFAEEAEKKLQNTKVTSFDFSFNKKDKKIKKQDRVAGLFTQLPFANDSFDMILSNTAMPFYMHNKVQLTAAFKEVIRVLKKGGTAHLGPITYTDIIDTDPQKTTEQTHRQHSYEESKKLFENILNDLKPQVEFTFIPKKEIEPSRPWRNPKIIPSILVLKKK